MKKSILIILIFLVSLTSCKLFEKEVDPEQQTYLKKYLLSYTSSTETNNYWTTFEYDEQNRISQVIERDTTFILADEQYVPSRTKSIYEYDADGFMVHRTREHLSVASSWEFEVFYTYTNGLLSKEDRGSRIIEYRYDDSGALSSTITSDLSLGLKDVVAYNDAVPAELQSDGEGYFVKEEEEHTYLDKDLNITKIEKYKAGALTEEKVYQYADGLVPLSALPNFKGFPKIKFFDYRGGIETDILDYVIDEGFKILTARREMSVSYNTEGYINKCIGSDVFGLSKPIQNTTQIEFDFIYEKK